MSKLATIVGLLAGTSLLLYWGGEAPGWLLKLECLAVMAASIAFGFTSITLDAPEWTRHDAVRGVLLVYLGVGAVFVPANLLLGAFLIGSGGKLVMRSAAPLARLRPTNPLGCKHDLVIKPEGGIRRR